METSDTTCGAGIPIISAAHLLQRLRSNNLPVTSGYYLLLCRLLHTFVDKQAGNHRSRWRERYRGVPGDALKPLYPTRAVDR